MAEDAFESDDLINTIFAQPGSTDHAAHPDFSREVNSITSETAFGGHKLSPEGECLPSDNQQLSNRETNTNTETSNDAVARIIEELMRAPTPHTDVIVTTSPKRGGYKVKDFTVATKRSRPVNFKLLRARPGVQLSISLTYQGHIYGDKQVKRCKKHDECTWCEGHQFNEGFCVISKFHRYELDHKGNPVVVLTPQAEHLDADGSVEFSVVFACWNSCDIHVRCDKEMTLHIQIMQDGGMKKVEYNIQCCENLSRDAFKDKKRKLTPQSENSQENPSKVRKASISSSSSKSGLTASSKASSSCPPTLPPASPPASPTSTDNKKSVDIVVEGLDKEKRDTLEQLVRTMGGTFNIQMRLHPSFVPIITGVIEGMGLQYRVVEERVGSVIKDPPCSTN